MTDNRIPIGIWLESNPGDQWANQGMTRLLAFIIEGLAQERRHRFCLVLMDHIRAEAEADLRTIAATIGVDYTLHSPRDHWIKADNFASLANFANDHVPVAGWLTLFPGYTHAKRLNAPVTAIFPDAIPLVFPDLSDAAWSKNGSHVAWTKNVTELLESAERVVTFSQHVATDQVSRLFGFDRDRTHVIHVAPPDLSPLLPFLKGRRRSDFSRQEAASLLSHHINARRLGYLRDFPFDEAPYIAVSTQDRITKNIRIVADAVRQLVRDDRYDARILMTAQLLLGTSWTPLPNLVETEQLQRDIISIPDLPRREHAAFYHCAEVAVHPSIFEGGMGTFPFYEAVSVGTPCLMADGPHQREMLARTPAIHSFVFDPNDSKKLAKLIKDVRLHRSEIVEQQIEIYEELKKRDWGDVAKDYASAATGNASFEGIDVTG